VNVKERSPEVQTVARPHPGAEPGAPLIVLGRFDPDYSYRAVARLSRGGRPQIGPKDSTPGSRPR
jgi:hypothetical protein